MAILLLITAILLLIDWYAFQAVWALLVRSRPWLRRFLVVGYWIVALFSAGIPTLFYVWGWENMPVVARSLLMSWMVIHYVPRLLMGVLLYAEDMYRLVSWLWMRLRRRHADKPVSISRKSFLSQTALIAGGLLSLQFIYGMARTAYQIRIVRLRLPVPGLPEVYSGLKIVHLSDLHLGSFMSVHPVAHAVELANAERPDVVFFTGDLVNNRSREALPFVTTLQRLQAPLGTFAVRGNHDFGDYYDWPREEDKLADEQLLRNTYHQMGWTLLDNKHHLINRDGHLLAIAGVDNWSVHRRFRQYGNLAQALQGTEAAAVRLLLSHDPTHWDAQVLPSPLPVAATFSGHTHGFQFGVEAGSIRWSPAQWLYPRWAGLYAQNGRYLYVNRGIGFIGYSGRVGIRPEITVYELVTA